METLLQNLEEQQIHLQQQQMSIQDLANMENVCDGKPSIPPPRKYVSIFRIDGEPILPPLMTAEKRRQMQKLKENALKIEQRLRERKQLAHCEKLQNNEDTKSENYYPLAHNSTGNISQRSQDSYETKRRETEESIDLLRAIIQRQQRETEENPVDTMEAACNTSGQLHRDENQEKLQKLQKSEILIYDNSTNEVIQVPAEKENRAIIDQRRKLREMESKVNNSCVPHKKPSHLLLVGVNSKGMTTIPSICLNPPTPLAVNKNLCETLNSAESSESSTKSETPKKSLDFPQDFSSDESFSSMVTQSDKKPNRNTRQSTDKLITKAENHKNVEKRVLTPAKHVCKKNQQLEGVSSDTNTPQTSPEKIYKTTKPCLGTSVSAMNRSATSPSIKLSASNRSSSSRSQSFGQDSDNSPESSLVRSSSFTLEGPSKALIEHMQQQKNFDKKTAVKSPLNITRNLSIKTLSSPLRAHRDTVESKAKKVQKVEVKPSRQKFQQKFSPSKLSQTAPASISPYNSIASTQHINNVCKTNKSPYDISKTSHASLHKLPKTSPTQIRKSNSMSSNLTQSKTSKPRLPSSSTARSSSRTQQCENESFTEMDQAQNEQFLQLLAQQDEEHQRLQLSFEIQQKMLIEQLSRESTTPQLNSPNKTHNSSSVTSTSQHKRYDQQQILSPQQSKQLNATGCSSDHGSQKATSALSNFKQHMTQPKHRQPSPSSISYNSSQISLDRRLSQTFNSFHTSHYIQSSQPIPLNLHLSLMDHSNANTSLDISTLSTQSSPDSPKTQTNTVQNVIANPTTPSSRRRLFSTEIKDARIDGKALKTRSPYTSGQRFVKHVQQPQPLDHNNKIVMPLTNDSNRRHPENNLILHAATKINATARGFLVRRLFQTEQIQRIVQTIRDTLIFVLNLHIETIENPEEAQTPANIKLKARLLQQLSSACRSLHFVFFQTSIKERMEIIARDRKRIKTKLMSMNRKRFQNVETKGNSFSS